MEPKTPQEIEEYVWDRYESLDATDFHDEVEVSFVDATMEIRWAFVEQAGDFVIVFAEHYPPLYQHVDETKFYLQRNSDGELVERWTNDERWND